MTDPTPGIDARRTALLVMDYQNGIVGRLGDDAEALLARVAQAIKVVRQHGGHIGYVRVAFEDADFDAIPPTSQFAALVASSGRAMHAGSPVTAVHESVAPEPGDIMVRKTRVGAFSTTDLAEQLRARQIDTLVLAGISTSGCVHSTVLDAYDRDYRVIVLSDAVADRDEAVHSFLLEQVFPKRGEVIDVRELHSLLH